MILNMKTAITWTLLLLLAVGGIGGSYALSEAFRTNAREAWEAEASQAARWLSGTVLGWLDESYAPLSGLAILFENSRGLPRLSFWVPRMPWKTVPPPFSSTPRLSPARGRTATNGPSNSPMIPWGHCRRTLL